MATGCQSMRLAGWVVVVLATAVVAAACSPASTGSEEAGALFHPDGWEGVTEFPASDLYDPVKAGENLPAGFRSVLRRDAIAPVYAPNFVTREESDWPDDELVIGVDLNGEARAYPVGFLTRREIVVDMHRGIPTFVTW